MAKYFYYLDPENTNIRAVNNQAFASACTNGHLHVLKWLYSLDTNVIEDYNELKEAFYWAIINLDHNIVLWLFSIIERDPKHNKHNKQELLDSTLIRLGYGYNIFIRPSSSSSKDYDYGKLLIKFGAKPKSYPEVQYNTYINKFYDMHKQTLEKYKNYLHTHTYSNTYASPIIQNIVKRYL